MIVETNPENRLRVAVGVSQRGWLEELIRSTGDKASVIAVRSNVSDTTLTRFLNGGRNSHNLSQFTIERIARAYNVPKPGEQGRAMVDGGLHDGELVDVERDAPELARMIRCLAGSDGDVWRLKTDALVMHGYLAGDLLVVAPSTVAQRYDLVLAETFDTRLAGRVGPITMFRVFDPPYLVATPLEPGQLIKPLLVDSDRVTIKGVVVRSCRLHRLSATQ